MVSNLHSLFSGAFYIDAQYASSFIPSLVQRFSNPSVSSDFNEKEKIDSLTNLNELGTESNPKSVVVLSIKQPILKFTDSWYGYLGSKSFINILSNLEKDKSVVGVVLDIDSGGGQVYGTPEFYDALRDFSKPSVAFTDGYMCSAAYYIGNATDHIIAHKRADHIGSIGAYASFVDGSGILEHFGGKVHTLYGTKSTEKNKEYREIMDNDNYKPYIKNQLDPIIETFHEDMKATRPQLNQKVFKGGTFNAENSLELNLIDEIGNMQSAIDKVFELHTKQTPKTKTTMSKERTLLQGVLAVDGPLAVTEENGSYLNEDQLDAVEAHLATNATAVQNAQDAQATAEDNLTQAQDSATALETQINAMATAHDIEPGETLADTLTAINTKMEELGKAPGASHSRVGKIDEEAKEFDYIDFTAPHYNN